MKIIAIGDIHGKTIWEKIVDQPFDKVVFVGDYFDCFDKISSSDQIDNFNQIIEFKKSNKDKVFVLLGNHDYHYLRGVKETYSGFQPLARFDIQEAIENSLKYIDICHIQDKYLFSHAGFTKTWCNKNGIGRRYLETNKMLYTDRNAFSFTSGMKRDKSGDEVCQSPLWVRPNSLNKDTIEGFTQIVGHTVMERNIKVWVNLIFIDTLEINRYLIIQDGLNFIKTIK
jgi:hypothetical protein